MVLRNLATSVLLYESVRTTQKRARVVQPIVDRLLCTANEKSPREAIRSIGRIVMDTNASRKILEVFTGRFSGRRSGFTRIVPVGARKGDGASLVDISLVPSDPSSDSSKP